MADLSVTAANVRGYGQHITGTLGGTVTAGQPVRKQADGTFIAATDASLAGSQVEGIALTGGGSGQPFIYQKGGNINPGATVAVGKVYVLSTSGGIAPVDDIASSEYITVIGVGISTSLIKMGIIVSDVQAAAAVS
jgi:hypothetical protein